MAGKINAKGAAGLARLQALMDEVKTHANYMKKNNVGGVFVGAFGRVNTHDNRIRDAYLDYKEPIQEMFWELKKLYNEGRNDGGKADNGYIFIMSHPGELWRSIGKTNTDRILKIFSKTGAIPIKVQLKWDDVWDYSRSVEYKGQAIASQDRDFNFVTRVLRFFHEHSGFELFGMGEKVLAAKDSIESLLPGIWRGEKHAIIYPTLHLDLKEQGKKY